MALCYVDKKKFKNRLFLINVYLFRLLDLAVHHAYCVYVECIIVHMLNVKKIHGEEGDYDMKLKVSICNFLLYKINKS